MSQKQPADVCSAAFVGYPGFIGAEGGTRTPTGFPTTPSRWRVCQFHHFGTGMRTAGELRLRSRLRGIAASAFNQGFGFEGVLVAPGLVSAGCDPCVGAGALWVAVEPCFCLASASSCIFLI